MAEQRVIVVDGSNIAHLEPTNGGKARVENIVSVCRALEKMGFDPIVIVDASLRHKVDDPDRLEKLLEKKQVLQAPAGTDADFFVLETAERHGSQVLSNDTYSQYRDRYAWIEKQRIPVMIVEGEVVIYEPKLEE